MVDSHGHNIIKVTYFLDGEESSVTFDNKNKLSVLRDIISLSLKVNFTEYEMVYNKKTFSNTDDRVLKEILGNDKNPIFFIKKKSNKFIFILHR
jgi:hypothetical protein